MAESTVANSLIGILDTAAGARGRREADGALVAQTQGQLLKNEKDRLLLDDESDRRDFSEAYGAGYIELDADGNFSVSPEQAQRMIKEAPDLLKRISGKEANPFFSTKGANGNEDIEYDGLEEIPQAPQKVPTLSGIPLQKPEAPQAPRYAIKLRKKDGSVAPATAGATADPNDTVITLTAEDVAKKLSRRVTRMQAAGAGGDAATMQSLKMDMHKAITANMQSALIGAGPDPAVPADGQRQFLDLIDDLEGDELKEAIRDRGLDPDKLEVDARKKWFNSQKKERTQAQLDYAKATDDLNAYENTKTILTNQVGRLDKALADYDKTQLSAVDSVDAESIRSGYPTIKSWGGGSPIARPAASSRNPKDPNNRTGKGGMSPRDEIIAERDAAIKQLAGLKPPTRPKMQSAMPATKFAWTDENLRASVAGKLPDSAPTQAQTEAVTAYAKQQGIASAKDLKKLPREDAQALAWIISHNTPGTEADKLSNFEALMNFARTGDMKKSPIDAEVAISGALNDTDQVAIAQQNANTNVDNAITNRMRVDWDQAKDNRDYAMKLAELGYKRSEDLNKELDKQNERLSLIRLGAMGSDGSDPQSGGVSIKDTGPTPQMADAAAQIRADMENAPIGSSKQIAASKAYLEAISMYGASAAAFTGKPAFWDWQKSLTNFFMRENAVVPISSMIENIQFDGYVNGVPSKFRILESGAGSKSTEAMTGSDTLDRVMGAGTFKALELAATSQRAVNRLQAEGTPVDETTLPAMIATIRKENGAK